MARDEFKIYFATDIHGSERCFYKFLNAGKFYGVDAVILGGDVTGKALVPLVEGAAGSYSATLLGKNEIVTEPAALDDLEVRIRSLGFYPYRTTPEEYDQMGEDEAYLSSVFDRVMVESTQRWVEVADKRLKDAGLPCLVMPGNDDVALVKDVLEEGRWIAQCDDQVVEFGPYQVACLGYSTITPWNSPRELTEEQMADHLDDLIRQIEPGQPVIFNIHNPPSDSGTDLAFQLTDDMRLKTAGGEPVKVPVGSPAVRAAIEAVQPVLSLHGHIHESRATATIGRTKICNPGSLYPDGTLQGVIVTLKGDKVKGFKLVSG